MRIIKTGLIITNFLVFIICVILITSCDLDKNKHLTGKAGWQTGFWVWSYNSEYDSESAHNVSNSNEKPLDILYVHAAEYYPNISDIFHGYWPDKLPIANAYIAVWRLNGLGNESLVFKLVEDYKQVKKKAAKSGVNVRGIQIDYDCPTDNLFQYARFLKNLRKTLPEEDILSITALLDWFKSDTKIADVLKWVDEFVPQFYDVNEKNISKRKWDISEVVDSAKWGPIFNSYKKSYKIGIASFGRIVVKNKPSEWRNDGIKFFYQDPLRLIACQNLTPSVREITPAGELIVNMKKTNNNIKEDGCLEYDSIEEVKMIIPTAKSIRFAYDGAKAMGGYCTGVIFFQLSVEGEGLNLTKEEINSAMQGKEPSSVETAMIAKDGLCVTVSCSDLYIKLKNRFSGEPSRFMISSTGDLEYFLPNWTVQGKMKNLKTIEVYVPAYASESYVSVGRAVSMKPVSFTVKEIMK
jgi:hypothetical protein